jgi:hypothetical protein
MAKTEHLKFKVFKLLAVPGLLVSTLILTSCSTVD